MDYGFSKKLKKNDKRLKRYSKQRKKWGFDDTETWGLDTVISRFILPRLKRFKKVNNCFPSYMTSEEWDATLDKMILAFELNAKDDMFDDEGKIQEGLDLFAKHFRELWW